MSEIARNWIETLAARGVSVTLRNNRLTFSPPRAYALLTDDERAILRAHRTAIKNLVSGGFVLAGPLEGRAEPTIQPSTLDSFVEPRPSSQAELPNADADQRASTWGNSPAELPAKPRGESVCAFCYQQPCIGDQHPAYQSLHKYSPLEVDKRDAKAFAEMLFMLPLSRRDRR